MKKLVFLFPLFLLMCYLATSHFLSSHKPPTQIRFSLDSDPQSLDPRIGGNGVSQLLTRPLFEGISRIGKEGLPVLALATSYTLSEDCTKYTFKLRPSKWSNGLDVTANDFVYAWKSIIDHSAESSFAYIYFLIKNAKDIYQGKASPDTLGLNALDSSTLEITLEHPVPYLLDLLSNPLFSPVCQAVVEKFPNWTKDHFVSNGPFMLDQYQIKSAALLKKNPFYWDCGSVKTDSLSFAIIEDTSTAYNMFLAGELDWYGQPFIAMMRTEFTHELERKKALHKMGKETIRWLVCNTQKKHLSTPEIRRALSLGIDRLSLCKDLLQREESPIYSILPKSLSFFPFAHQKADPAAAKKLLRSALGAAGFQNDEIPTFHLLVRMNPVYVLISQAIQAQLKKDLDIDIQFELCESSVYWQRLSSGKFDLAFGSWFSWFADPMYNLNILRDANSGIISTPWESTEYKKLLCAADLEQDQEKRNTLLREAELLIMTELPIIPICSESGRYAKTNIQGEIFSTIGELDLKEIERAP